MKEDEKIFLIPIMWYFIVSTTLYFLRLRFEWTAAYKFWGFINFVFVLRYCHELTSFFENKNFIKIFFVVLWLTIGLPCALLLSHYEYFLSKYTWLYFGCYVLWCIISILAIFQGVYIRHGLRKAQNKKRD